MFVCVCCVCLLLYTPLLYSTKYLCVWCAVYARTVHVYVLFMLVRVNISVRHCWRCNAVIFIGVWVWLECMRACIVFSSSTTPASNRQTIQADTPAKTKTFMCLCLCVCAVCGLHYNNKCTHSVFSLCISDFHMSNSVCVSHRQANLNCFCVYICFRYTAKTIEIKQWNVVLVCIWGFPSNNRNTCSKVEKLFQLQKNLGRKWTSQ